jgi:hypothetical protein
LKSKLIIVGTSAWKRLFNATVTSASPLMMSVLFMVGLPNAALVELGPGLLVEPGAGHERQRRRCRKKRPDMRAHVSHSIT